MAAYTNPVTQTTKNVCDICGNEARLCVGTTMSSRDICRVCAVATGLDYLSNFPSHTRETIEFVDGQITDVDVKLRDVATRYERAEAGLEKTNLFDTIGYLQSYRLRLVEQLQSLMSIL